MAVIHRHDDKHCLILDQQQYLREIYKNTNDARKSSSSESSKNLIWAKRLFNVVKPFRTGLNHNRKRKTNKKRTHDEAFDEESNGLLERLKTAAEFCRDRLSNDEEEAEIRQDEDFFDSIPLAEIATQNCDRLPAVRKISFTDYFLRASKLGIQVNIIYSHDKTEPSIVDTAVAGEIILPSQSRFLWSDIKNLKILIDEGRKYSFVVIDPPWSNKSVRRQRPYQWSDLTEIESLPIENLIDRDRPSLICCWSTNCDRIEKFVKDKLLGKWRCQYLSTWHWLKITRRGEPVLDLESADKKSYETLILACSAEDRRFESLKTNSKIFCSVPALIHSAKPALHPMFQNLIDFPRTEENFCLEIFARNLLPNFTSVGNEVFKNQKLEIFEKCEIQN